MHILTYNERYNVIYLIQYISNIFSIHIVILIQQYIKKYIWIIIDNIQYIDMNVQIY